MSIEDLLKRIERLEAGYKGTFILISELGKPEAREEYWQELNEIYLENKYFSIRYAAGRAMGICKNQLDANLSNVSRRLEHKLSSTKEVVESKQSGSGTGYVHNPIVVPDIEKRLDTTHDAAKLYELSKSFEIQKILDSAYEHNDSAKTRDEAGKALGYSKFRRMFKETIRWIWPF